MSRKQQAIKINEQFLIIQTGPRRTCEKNTGCSDDEMNRSRGDALKSERWMSRMGEDVASQ